MANSMRKENTISVVLTKESSMLAVAPIVQDTRKPLPKQPINNTSPKHGANAIKNNNAYGKRESKEIQEIRLAQDA